MLNMELEKRNLPDLFTYFNGKRVTALSDWELRREEILNCFQTEMYGIIPSPPIGISFREESCIERFCAGKALLHNIVINTQLKAGDFSFPITAIIPKKNIKHTFVYIDFKNGVGDKYFPAEELVDNGCAVFRLYYDDITADNDDFTDGLAGVFYPDGKRAPTDPGKIAIWAWGLLRVMDYIETLDCINKNNVCVIGHSRLGKTALLAAAFDSRFTSVVSNNSGCCGAAIQRGNTGEQFSNIYSSFGYWFCSNFEKYIEACEKFPLDQHCLLATIAPRKVYIASAELDPWADPRSEFLSGVAASRVYPLFNAEGLVHNDKFPVAEECLHDGKIGYHIRHGLHYLSRTDWLYCINYLLKHSAY